MLSCRVGAVMPKTAVHPRPRQLVALLLALALFVLVLPLASATVSTTSAAEDGWQARQLRKSTIKARDRALAERLPSTARLGYHPETGRVRFLSGVPGTPLRKGLSGVAAGKRVLSVADARGVARKFVDRYGPLFGVTDPARELRTRETRRQLTPSFGVAADAGAGLPNATVRFEQVRDGLPVMGGELVVQLTEDGEVLSAAGEVMPSATATAGQARIGVKQARNVAASWIARETGRAASAVRTTSEGLAHYDPRVMDDPTLAALGTRLVWRIDARASATAAKKADRRLVLVDARSGQVLTTIGRIATAEGPNRKVCDNRNVGGRSWTCDSPFTRQEGQAPVGIRDVDAVYRLMGVTYDYFWDRFGRDGIDGKGSRMKATVRYCPAGRCPWNNAEWRWGPQQATFGRGWAVADDIVAHEYTHGVLDHEAPLFYHYQSGAINEAYADVFGELIDLSYSGGKDTKSSKWKIGEDTPLGAFRDMRDPTRKGHADRVRSPKWHTSTSDYGGVHRNNGVGNKAAYLMAAGGNFQGYRIKGIGRERMGRVWYQALTTRLTSAANYVDLADALIAACTDLVGSHGVTSAHCKSVRDATRATQMNLRPKSFAPASAPVCGARKTPVDVFRDDLEDPDSGAWAAMKSVGSAPGWYWPQNPNNAPGWDGTWASSGKTNFYAPNRGSRTDATMRMTEAVVLPAKAFLRFGHGYSFDKDARKRYDGGIVEFKIDDGPWRGVGGRFTHGGYNGTIAKGRGNPLAGKRAYTGNSKGWARARIDLSDFAGSRIKVRFRVATDRSVGGRGWYVDDVRIYACVRDDDKPTGSLIIDGGAATTTDRKVDVGLSWDDATTWVRRVRLSSSPKLNAKGLLKNGITLPVRDVVSWDLGDRTFGASGQRGKRGVYAQYQDAVGNWSKVVSDSIEWVAP